MQKNPSSDRSHPRHTGVFAIEEELCVWMQAKVVNFKLCDKTYDCLNCEFDKAMSEAWSVRPTVKNE